MIKTIILLAAICISSVGSTTEITDDTCHAVEQQLQEGDIVFLNIDNWLYRKVAAATKSWTTHVGMTVQEGGRWMVAESTIPFSKKTEFCRFLKKTAEGQFSIRRLNAQDAPRLDLNKMRAAIEANMSRPYDLHFNYDGSWMFCSKFVYEIYKQASGLEIGKIETLGEIRDNNPDGDPSFWEYWFLGNVPWSQRTITPQAQFVDAKLVTVVEQL